MSIRTRFDRAIVVAAILGAASFAVPARAQDDASLATYRERFKQGLERYGAGDVAGALSFWEPLYHDLGPSRGYRIGYNLARAYEVVGDATRAAERYESFLTEVASRQKANETQDPLVAHEAVQAQARLDELGKTRGRVRVMGSSPPVSVRIDGAEPRLSGFVAYLAPGTHEIVFAPGTGDEHRETVEAHAGEVVDVAPAPVPPPSLQRTTDTPPQPFAHVDDRVVPPFSSAWLWVAGVATIASGGVTAAAYANAMSIHDAYADPYPRTLTEVNRYHDAQTLAYASWAVPAIFATTTAVLVTWYLLGKKHVRVTAAPQAGWAF